MTRTERYRATYVALVGGGAAIAAAAAIHFDLSTFWLVVAVALLLLPGRVLGYAWRDLLRGLRHLQAKDYVQSKRHSERFLGTLAARPWIRHLVWLGSFSYSRDPMVLALSNLGAAEIGLGLLDEAEAHLRQASARDPECPLVFHNLGVVHRTRGDDAEAESCFATARRLGFTGGLGDRIVMHAQARFAATDGAGRS